MRRDNGQIGLSQRIRLEWLEYTSSLIQEGYTKTAINEALQERLKDKVSVGGNAIRGNREKAITILFKVWLSVPPERESLRTHALQLLQRLTKEERMAIHWGMVAAAYPFWADVALQVGRLIRLQGVAVAAQVQRRIREIYGERETVSRAARRLLRSYVDWEVLQETGKRGIYAAGDPTPVEDAELIAWLMEASLHARPNGTVALKKLLESPGLFPFQLRPIPSSHLANRFFPAWSCSSWIG